MASSTRSAKRCTNEVALALVASSEASATLAVGYIRVSDVAGRDEKGDSYGSPDIQRSIIERWASEHDVVIVGWYIDEDAPAEKVAKRVEFEKALRVIESGQASMLVVAKLSRFARTSYSIAKHQARIEAAGGRFVAIDTPQSEGAMGEFAFNVSGAVVQMERSLIRDNWKEARRRAVKLGKSLAAHRPLGYDFDERHHLVVNERERGVVHALYLRRAAGESWANLSRFVERELGRTMHPGAIRGVVSNRVYLGELSFDDVVNASAHEPIVTLHEWQAAQTKGTPPRPGRGGGERASLLSGLITCASCGRPMSFRGGKGADYTCKRVSAAGRCEQPVLVRASKLDAFVEAFVLDALDGARAVGVSDGPALVASLERQLADLDAEHARWETMIAKRPNYPLARIEARLDEYDGQRGELLGKLDDARAACDVDVELVDLRERWSSMTLAERRRFVPLAIESLTVHPGVRGNPRPIEERIVLVPVHDTSEVALPIAA